MPEGKEPVIMTKAKVRAMYFGMFLSLLTFVYPILKQTNPELLETEAEHQMIKDEAQDIALNFPTLMKDKHEKEEKELAYKLRIINNKIIKTQSSVDLLSEDLNSYKPIIDGVNKQINFNSFNCQTNSEALFDLMRNDDNCNKVRYTRNKVDRFILFSDWYEQRTLQPIIAGSGCKVTVAPFDRNRIRL